MTQLLVEENGAFTTLFDTANVHAANMRVFIYQGYIPPSFTPAEIAAEVAAGRFHTESTRQFTLRQANIAGRPSAQGQFVRMDIWARVGQEGANTVFYGGSSSEYVAPSGWADSQMVRHGFQIAPPADATTFQVTTNYPMPTTDPSLYLLAIAAYN